jgi:cell wall-associated NlpC family hydrolase
MALEEIQAVSARMAALDQRMQQLSGGTALMAPAKGVAATDFDQILGQNMARTSRSGMTPASAVGTTSNSPTVERALDFAGEQLGDPYVFGAEGPDAWDCSSLVQAAFQRGGVTLPRTASEQAQVGTSVPVDRNAIKPGDLVFLRGGKPAHDLGHVGIAVSADQFIVAPHTGATVQVQDIPWSRVQRVRRVA